MEISAGIQSSLSGRYASALFELAGDAGSIPAVESDLETLRMALDESDDLRSLTTNPELSRSEQGAAIAGIADLLKLNGLTINFLGVLAQNRRLDHLKDIIAAFGMIAAAQRGEVTAEVTSAHPLSKAQLAKLEKKLAAREGRAVTIKATTDPELLGGLVITIGSQRIDGSIRTRLNSLAQAMKA